MPTSTSTIKERAPLMRVFGPLAERMADILRSRPSLSARIAFAPPEAIHAIAAFLYLAPEAAASDAQVGDLIEQSDPRDLLAMALPDCPARLYRALDRAGSSVREQAFYLRLAAVCRGSFGSAFLDGDLNEMRLDFYEAIQSMDPLIADLRTALPETRHIANAVDTLIASLRGYGIISECDLALPRNAGVGAVFRRILRGVYAVRAPRPPFTVPASLRLVETIGELRDIGRRFRNCLAPITHFSTKHWFDLAEGSSVFLLVEEPPLLIELRRVGPGLWHIDQMAAPKNAPTPFALLDTIEQTLRDTGIRLVSASPVDALANLERAARRPKRDASDDIDDLEETWDGLDAA